MTDEELRAEDERAKNIRETEVRREKENFAGYSTSGVSAPTTTSAYDTSQFLNSDGSFNKDAFKEKLGESYLLVMNKIQDDLVAGGKLKAEERADFKNKDEITKFYKKYFELELMSKIPSDQRAKLMEKGGINWIFSGYDPSVGLELAPDIDLITESLSKRLEFATSTDWTERQIVEHFYTQAYLEKLNFAQNAAINGGYIRPEERVSLDTLANVQLIELKAVNYLALANFITEDKKQTLTQTITKIIPEMQKQELQRITDQLNGNLYEAPVRNDALASGNGSCSSPQTKTASSILGLKEKPGADVYQYASGNLAYLNGIINLLSPFWAFFEPTTANAGTKVELKSGECYNDKLYSLTKLWAFHATVDFLDRSGVSNSDFYLPTGWFTVTDCCLCIRCIKKYCFLDGCWVHSLFFLNFIYDRSMSICEISI